MEKILSLHPDPGKTGVNIDKGKYEFVRQAILDELQKSRELTYQELNKRLKAKLSGNFDGSIPWYVVTVKLDLEARGLIARIPGSRPQMLRLSTKDSPA